LEKGNALFDCDGDNVASCTQTALDDRGEISNPKQIVALHI
jgi:hypothetical protein